MRHRRNLTGQGETFLLAALLVVSSSLASAETVSDWLITAPTGELHSASLGECPLENGEVIEDCRLTFRTYGTLAPDLGISC